MDAITSGAAANENTVQTDVGKDNIIEIEIPYPLFQYLSSEECNVQNICRICLSVNDQELYPLFSAHDNSVLANMFMAISEVQTSAEDGLPSNICSRCQTEVMNYYEFKMKCVKSDYTLKSVLKGEFVTKEEFKECDNKVKTDTQLHNVSSKMKNEDKVINDSKNANIEVNTKSEAKIEHTDFKCLEDLKESMSDDEALCIVRETQNNGKQITIIDNDPNTLYKEVVMQKETNPDKKTKHYCTFCPKKFHKVTSLRAHITKRHAAMAVECPYPCGQCKEAFTSEFDLSVHGMLHNEDCSWRCTECNKDFGAKQALRRHIQRHMQSKRFPCGICDKSFVELYALRRHARVHTGEQPEKKHACQQCDKRFMDAGSLATHMSRHSGVRSCVCCVCGAAFPSARLLASHRRVHSADKPHACEHCGKRFRHESTRNTHRRTHTGERPFVCAQCGKSFIQKSNMTLHMRTHTGEKPYSCSFCERTFSSGSTLKAHKRTHTGERPFSCKVCGKSFARLNLKLHMRVHTGERPHACPACPKRFSNGTRLRDHYRMHTGEKPFECAMCSEKFSNKSQLLKHVKRHEKKKKTSKKAVVMLMPVTVSDKSLHSTDPQPENKPSEYMILNINTNPNVVPNIDQTNLCTVEETPMPSQGLVYQDDGNMKTEVIVLGNDPSLVPNGVSYVNDVNYTNDMNLVTVNEGEVSISAASATMEGTTVKLYQYDQSLLQIHTGGGQLTIRRISSKMTTNF